MAKDRDNVRIYGDDASGVWVADKGTTGPTSLAAPGVGYEEVGWLGEDGVDLDRSEDVSEFKAWQGGSTLRKKVTSQEDSFKFVALEETALTMGLYYKGVTPTTATGVDTYVIADQAASDERAWVVDLVDGDITKRYVISSGEVTGRETVPHKNSDLTMYSYTVTIYGDYVILKTSAA